jgi:RNA polymerase sigma factor (TIGR02999 family)
MLADSGGGGVSMATEPESGTAGEFFEEVYSELKRLARARMQRLRPGQTLQTTALVHEAYLKLSRREDPRWSSRTHFFADAARAMRDILVDAARRKGSRKRGGDRRRVGGDLLEQLAVDCPPQEILDLDEAMTRLEADSPRKARIASLRLFAGLPMGEIAVAVETPLRTVEREWRFARAWLQSELNADDGGKPP